LIKTKASFSLCQKTRKNLLNFGGKRKGNWKAMTGALRNYARTEEVIRIRRKLTYQFSEAIVQRLSPPPCLRKEVFYSQCVPPGQEYLSLNNWSANYNRYPYANYHELSHPDY
jgi:hypothetical protein